MVIGGARERRVLAIVARFLLCGGGQLAGESSAVVSCSLLDRGCWTFVACQTCVLRNAGGALVELRSEQERCR